MAYKHGIYTTESPTSLTTPITGTAGLPLFVGTAPVNTVVNAAVNKPILVNKYEDAVAQLGYSENTDKYTLSGAIYALFEMYNVAPVIFINVLDPNNPDHVKNIDETEKKPQAHKIIIDNEGVISNTVTLKSGENVLVSGDDFDISYDSNNRCIISLVETSDFYDSESFTVAYSILDPTAVTAADIVGAYEGATGKETGLHLARSIFSMFGVLPGLFCAPKYSSDPTVAAKLQSLNSSIPGGFEAESVIDIDTVSAKKYTDVKSEKNAAGINDKHAIAVWPMAKIGDKKIHLSTLVTVAMAYNDAEAGDVPTNPSNKPINISALIDSKGNEIYLDIDQANELNAQGILTVVNFNGFRIWGNNTAAYPETTDPKDRWIRVRRYFTWRKNNFKLSYFQKVDDPGNYRLIESVVDSENIVGNSHVANGLAAEDRIEFRESDNPITDILNGVIRFKFHLAPYIPAEVITADFEFNPYAFTGGTE